MKQKKYFSVKDQNVITEGVTFIEDVLKQMKVNKKLIIRSMLLSEEILAHLLDTTNIGADVSITVKKTFGDAEIIIRAKGQELNPVENDVEGIDGLEDLGDEDLQRAIRQVLLNSQGEQLKFSYKNGINQIRILVGEAQKSMLVQTVKALALGLIFGFILKELVPASLATALCSNVLEPIKSVFMNALRIIIAPVVFFSIVSCFSQYKNISEVGRVGAKVMGMYTLTTVIAVCLGIGVSLLMKPGTFGFAKDIFIGEPGADIQAAESTSIIDTILGIVPNNFLSPFLESNTLQIIFLAVLCGMAVGMIGEYSEMLREFFAACSSLFLTITSLIAQFIPVAVFCSIVLIVNSISIATFYSLLGMIGAYLVAVFTMFCVYGILILVLARLNPIRFYKNNREGMITGFSLSSSNAAMPTNIRICTEKMGVAAKIANFSIPLGATVNMDGYSIFLSIIGLFLARAYGIEVPNAALLSLAITVILLSLGAPGVPGGSVVSLGVILPTLGVPIEGLGLILAIYPFMDMLDTMMNTTGDIAAAVIVAKSENSIDTDRFYGRS